VKISKVRRILAFPLTILTHMLFFMAIIAQWLEDVALGDPMGRREEMVHDDD
jgi:hypothetical protein